MSIRIFLPFITLCFMLGALLLQPVASLGGGREAFAPLKAGSFYAGSLRNSRGESTVELHLLDQNFFVLRQTLTPQGKPPFTRDLTGNWRQVGDGALLRLTNRHGLALGLNIGGGGNLYGDFFPLPGVKLESLILKKASPKSQTFFVIGSLERSPNHSALTDSASGREFTLLHGEGLATLPAESPLFVDAEVMLTKKGLNVKSIRSFSQNFPQYAAIAPTQQYFKASVEGASWLLPPIAGLPVASCTFQNGTQGNGVLEIMGKGLRLSAAYTLVGAKLQFSIKEHDSRTLQALGAEALVHMLEGVRSWAMEGDALVLADDGGQSFLLEKAMARGQTRSLTR